MSYDLLIKNGTVVDGSGAPQYRADVAVVNGKIAEIGSITDSAKQVVDAADLIVAPGFIDPSYANMAQSNPFQFANHPRPVQYQYYPNQWNGNR